MSDPIDQEIRILRAIFWSERDPEGRAFVPLADAYLRKGSPDEALSLLEDGLGRHPEFASAHMVAARAYRAVGARGAAHRALSSVLELDPGNASALRMKGELAESEGNTAIALTAFQEALDRNPGYEDLQGRIERLALGIPGAEPSAPPLHDVESSRPDASADASGGSAAGADPFDLPQDDPLAIQGQESFLESYPLDAAGVGRGPVEADTPFSLETQPGDADQVDDDVVDADFIDVDLVEADPVEGDLLEPGRADARLANARPADAELLEPGAAETDPGDADFGIEDFPSDEGGPPADVEGLEQPALGVDRLELEPPADDRRDSGDRRAGDLEAHESLAAEGGPPRPEEARPFGDVGELDPGDGDFIDPFGFESSVEAAGAPAASPESERPDEADAGQATTPPVSDDSDVPEWSLPSGSETPRAVSGVEPLPVTRTLGELYARQGLISQAAGVFEALLERNPDDEALRERLSELRGRPPAASPAAHPDPAPVAPESVEMVAVSEHEAPSMHVRDQDHAAATGAADSAGFSVADQPIGTWFEDLLAWAPGAIPVEHLAPGAVPIETLAPAGWSGTSVAPPESEPGEEPAVQQPGAEIAEPDVALPAATAAPPERQIEAVASDSADRAGSPEGEASPGASREDGFEGLDDFQDWLRSLDR